MPNTQIAATEPADHGKLSACIFKSLRLPRFHTELPLKSRWVAIVTGGVWEQIHCSTSNEISTFASLTERNSS
jgi:hypothetical protein